MRNEIEVVIETLATGTWAELTRGTIDADGGVLLMHAHRGSDAERAAQAFAGQRATCPAMIAATFTYGDRVYRVRAI
jgi:hypothetical protein